ncbi:10693_t:CDS:2, partial [Gigaspora rosea]
KRPDELATFLFDVFVCFGAPTILQTDNGREFTAKVIHELLKIKNYPKGWRIHSEKIGQVLYIDEMNIQTARQILETQDNSEFAKVATDDEFEMHRVAADHEVATDEEFEMHGVADYELKTQAITSNELEMQQEKN